MVLKLTSMSKFGSGRYGVWIRIEEALPWIELEQTYGTRKEALLAAKLKLRDVKVEVVDMAKPANEGERCVPMIKIGTQHK